MFYTTLVLTAVLTSQAAGAWLRFVLSKGWPLLSTNPTETWASTKETEQAPQAGAVNEVNLTLLREAVLSEASDLVALSHTHQR